MRSTRLARLHLLAVYLAAFGWLFAVSYVLTAQFTSSDQRVRATRMVALIFVVSVSLVCHVVPRLLVLAERGKLFPGRTLTLLSIVGVVAFWLGASFSFKLFAFGDWRFVFAVCCGLTAVGLPAGGVAILLIPVPARPAVPRFLVDRTHAAAAAARRCLAAIALHAVVAALAVTRAREFHSEPGVPDTFPRVLFLLGTFYVSGMILSWLQQYPHRAMGLLPYAALVVALGFLCAWVAPQAVWPVALLGVAAGLAHVGPRAWLVLLVPPGQRGGAALLAVLAATLGAAAGAGLTFALPTAALPLVRVLIALALVAAAGCFLFRELFEQTLEFILWIFYPVRGYGPGLLSCPTRGPVIVIANHAAWVDPIWLAKVIPVQLRPMMVSRFFDLPVIRFLMRRVFHAIRVPDAGFRREAPEVQDAIAALDRGQNVLIFPEGWLRRREEQSVRRFGQGVYHILREMPRTPVIACWIEGNWGSYTSFFKGPPTKNKKMDLFRPIRIGVSDPEVLPLELLHDGHQTRRYLMLAVLNARRHLGLDPLPPPPFAASDDYDQGEPGVSDRGLRLGEPGA